LASWQKRENISSLVSIEGFEDPFYLLSTGGKVSHKINKTIYEGIYVIDGNKANLNSHLNLHAYTNHNDAPSFLKRLEGKNEADENGIESFVNLAEFTQQGVPVYTKSCVDHVYFSSSSVSSSVIVGMPSWFRLDDAHFSKYNITG
jgi:hypothetical protein